MGRGPGVRSRLIPLVQANGGVGLLATLQSNIDTTLNGDGERTAQMIVSATGSKVATVGPSVVAGRSVLENFTNPDWGVQNAVEFSSPGVAGFLNHTVDGVAYSAYGWAATATETVSVNEMDYDINIGVNQYAGYNEEGAFIITTDLTDLVAAATTFISEVNMTALSDGMTTITETVATTPPSATVAAGTNSATQMFDSTVGSTPAGSIIDTTTDISLSTKVNGVAAAAAVPGDSITASYDFMDIGLSAKMMWAVPGTDDWSGAGGDLEAVTWLNSIGTTAVTNGQDAASVQTFGIYRASVERGGDIINLNSLLIYVDADTENPSEVTQTVTDADNAISITAIAADLGIATYLDIAA